MKTITIKNLFLLAIFCICLPQFVTAQEQVTRFLGLPVDGSKEEMIENLIAKGYDYNREDDYFTGIYYGNPVYIFIATQNNVVSRVILYDVPQRDAVQIKERFNMIYSKYKVNSRYIDLLKEDVTIPANEDVAHEMQLHNKHYRAVFGQARTNPNDSLAQQTGAQLPTEQFTYDKEALRVSPKERRRRMHARAMNFVTGAETSKYKNQVWFTISERYGKFGIVQFYENKRNMK